MPERGNSNADEYCDVWCIGATLFEEFPMEIIEILFAANMLAVAGIVLLDFLHSDTLKLLSAFSLAYFYSAILPAGAYIAGGQIYAGIDPRYIPDALFLSLLCLGGLLVAGFLAQFRTQALVPPAWEPEAPGKISVLIAIAVFSSIFLAAVYNIDVFFMPKTSDSSALFSLHYKVLLLASVFCCVFISLYWKTGGIAAYGIIVLTIYCLVFKERDFFLAGLLGALVLYSKKKIGNKSILIIAVFALSAFSYLSVGRSAVFESFDISTVANQGSNLFVNTFVTRYFEHTNSEDFYLGQTYYASFIDTITLGYVPFRPTLASWLAGEYTGPWGTGGYGFSIEAEAFMNFGYYGAFGLFLAIGVFLHQAESLAMRGYRSGRIMLGWSVMFLMYGIRGESLNIFKSFMLVVIVAAVFHILDTEAATRSSIARIERSGTLKRR